MEIRNAVWIDPEQSEQRRINCEIKKNDEWLPFTALSDDRPDIWQRLMDGEAGEIAPYSEPEPEPPTKTDLIARLEARLIQVDTGGTLWSGTPISTTDRAQSKLDAALNSYDDGSRSSDQTVVMPAVDGTPIRLTRDQLAGVKKAVVDHVSAAYDAYDVIYGEIQSGAVTTIEDVDTHPAWSANGEK